VPASIRRPPSSPLSLRRYRPTWHRPSGAWPLRPGCFPRTPSPAARDVAAARREPDDAPGEHHLTFERSGPLHAESRGSAGPRPGPLTARPGRPGLPLPAAGLVCGIRRCGRRPRSRAPRRDRRGCHDRVPAVFGLGGLPVRRTGRVRLCRVEQDPGAGADQPCLEAIWAPASMLSAPRCGPVALW